ncbi:hypothetical protein G6F35_014716 [Rhizopus arrhizus]|nr:hypothetical protein G6F35_014716 [Rhizopus arrhizus]
MALQAECNQKTRQHGDGGRQEDGRVTVAAGNVARDWPRHAQGQVQECRVRAQRRAAAAGRHARHRLHADGGKYQRKPATGQCRTQQRGRGVGRQPQQQQPCGLDQERDLRHAEAAEARDGARKQQAHADERAAEGAKRMRRPLPGEAGVVQRHEGRQCAETHRTQPQRHAVREDAHDHALERHAVAAHDRHGGARYREAQAGQTQQQHHAAQRTHAPFGFQLDAQRRAQRQAAVGADPVPGDDAGGVQRADPRDRPGGRTR